MKVKYFYEERKLTINGYVSEHTLYRLDLAFDLRCACQKCCLFQRLSRPEVLENIMMATPGLSEDPVAISIIQDPELLVHMENADTVRR
jgi:hypothetical protein